MTEQSPSSIGTVAQEAARLIEDMATMARSGYNRDDDGGSYPGQPAQEPGPTFAPQGAGGAQAGETREPGTGGSQAKEPPSGAGCSQCGAPQDAAEDGVPTNCTLCPLCRGIGLLRSIRPETVDLLADLAMSLAASLRDVATWSRASDPGSATRSTSGGPADPDRSPVQDIPVDDESEG
ncbi:MAG TPA: hypothetical protein VIJ15_14915 [Dermatophilaceae bacterium]